MGAQVWCGCCSHAGQRPLRCTWGSPPGVAQPVDEAGRERAWNHSDPFLDQLGGALLALLAAIPAGVLVFLPSYALLERAAQRWRQTGAWAAMAERKPCLQSEAMGRTAADTKRAVEEMVARHQASVGAGGGACLLAVYRGGLSEGISFDDDDCRGVVCVGLPLPNKNDPQIQAKLRHNSALAAEQRKAGGPCVLDRDGYYTRLGWRALNQALGRAVRHPRDYGAMLLLDERHSHPNHNEHLPSWLRVHGLRTHAAPVPNDAAQVADILRGFFSRAEARFGRGHA